MRPAAAESRSSASAAAATSFPGVLPVFWPVIGGAGGFPLSRSLYMLRAARGFHGCSGLVYMLGKVLSTLQADEVVNDAELSGSESDWD